MSIVRKVVKEIEKRKALTAILLMLFMMLFFDTRFYTAYNLLDKIGRAHV